jgi:hypothetical protein
MALSRLSGPPLAAHTIKLAVPVLRVHREFALKRLSSQSDAAQPCGVPHSSGAELARSRNVAIAHCCHRSPSTPKSPVSETYDLNLTPWAAPGVLRNVGNDASPNKNALMVYIGANALSVSDGAGRPAGIDLARGSRCLAQSAVQIVTHHAVERQNVVGTKG